MTQIFIFTAGNSSARSHLDDSIINPIDFKKVETSLEKIQIEKLLISNNENSIFCWGAMPGKNNLRNDLIIILAITLSSKLNLLIIFGNLHPKVSISLYPPRVFPFDASITF